MGLVHEYLKKICLNCINWFYGLARIRQNKTLKYDKISELLNTINIRRDGFTIYFTLYKHYERKYYTIDMQNKKQYSVEEWSS